MLTFYAHENTLQGILRYSLLSIIRTLSAPQLQSDSGDPVRNSAAEVPVDAQVARAHLYLITGQLLEVALQFLINKGKR
jgi:hypothetical protein